MEAYFKMKGVLLYIICLYCINRWRKPIATEIPIGSIWCVCVCVFLFYSRSFVILISIAYSPIIGYIGKLRNWAVDHANT